MKGPGRGWQSGGGLRGGDDENRAHRGRQLGFRRWPGNAVLDWARGDVDIVVPMHGLKLWSSAK
jgi:hypothetical protein